MCALALFYETRLGILPASAQPRHCEHRRSSIGTLVTLALALDMAIQLVKARRN